MKSKNFIIPLVIYPFDVMVSAGEDYDSLAKHIIKKWGAEFLQRFDKYENNTGDGTFFLSIDRLGAVIKLKKFMWQPYYYGVLAHEIFHVVEAVLDATGMKVTTESREAYAYLIGYLTEEIYKQL